MKDTIERLQTQLERAQRRDMIAVAVEVEDVKAIVQKWTQAGGFSAQLAAEEIVEKAKYFERRAHYLEAALYMLTKRYVQDGKLVMITHGEGLPYYWQWAVDALNGVYHISEEDLAQLNAEISGRKARSIFITDIAITPVIEEAP